MQKTRLVAEDLIFPAALNMASTTLDDNIASKMKVVPPSNGTIVRGICDISNEHEEPTKTMKNPTKDEATDSSKDCLFIAYVCFTTSESL